LYRLRDGLVLYVHSPEYHSGHPSAVLSDRKGTTYFLHTQAQDVIFFSLWARGVGGDHLSRFAARFGLNAGVRLLFTRDNIPHVDSSFSY
jgi:hypothetical protein